MSDDLLDSRSPDRIRHHYEVERELAARLRASNREERTVLFQTLYDELFRRVPDHPRLTRRESPEELRRKVTAALRLLKPHLGPEKTLVEFAPGDGALADAAAALCHRVIGIDISDQRANPAQSPANVEVIVYDGYHCPLPDACADVAFSCMFLEHLHPDDIQPHFELALRLLKPGGVYVAWTPHRFSGPHDVSRHFGDSLDCFHFQEWTVAGLKREMRKAGFGRVWIYRGGRLWKNPVINALEGLAERLWGSMPPFLRKPVSARLFRAVVLAAEK
ncbi:MAG: class I SAM-dependent methyltransferase [Verrucomicrobia bacterium]|nr:class I SAM-dependent methyltransferase [Verrucomicrobiota bacterium]